MPIFRREREPQATPDVDPKAVEAAQAELGEALPDKEYGFVHELDPDFLRFIYEKLEQRKGKFVRVGEMILVAPLEETWGNRTRKPQHMDFLSLANESSNDDFKLRLIRAQSAARDEPGALDPRNGILDAGRFEFRVGQDYNLKQFTIFGWSSGYGEAPPEQRDRTIEIAKRVLGPGVEFEKLSDQEVIKKMMLGI